LTFYSSSTIMFLLFGRLSLHLLLLLLPISLHITIQFLLYLRSSVEYFGCDVVILRFVHVAQIVKGSNDVDS